jgi:hypothetical protein
LDRDLATGIILFARAGTLTATAPEIRLRLCAARHAADHTGQCKSGRSVAQVLQMTLREKG